mmetsp:Transcript_166595/g.529410  ORF Transcript_166595/g.529410 Transcript_166595/m.529410 type:complete len:329 (+) Transcript_166595:1994-2980(+)
MRSSPPQSPRTGWISPVPEPITPPPGTRLSQAVAAATAAVAAAVAESSKPSPSHRRWCRRESADRTAPSPSPPRSGLSEALQTTWASEVHCSGGDDEGEPATESTASSAALSLPTALPEQVEKELVALRELVASLEERAISAEAAAAAANAAVVAASVATTAPGGETPAVVVAATASKAAAGIAAALRGKVHRMSSTPGSIRVQQTVAWSSMTGARPRALSPLSPRRTIASTMPVPTGVGGQRATPQAPRLSLPAGSIVIRPGGASPPPAARCRQPMAVATASSAWQWAAVSGLSGGASGTPVRLAGSAGSAHLFPVRQVVAPAPFPC